MSSLHAEGARSHAVTGRWPSPATSPSQSSSNSLPEAQGIHALLESLLISFKNLRLDDDDEYTAIACVQEEDLDVEMEDLEDDFDIDAAAADAPFAYQSDRVPSALAVSVGTRAQARKPGSGSLCAGETTSDSSHSSRVPSASTDSVQLVQRLFSDNSRSYNAVAATLPAHVPKQPAAAAALSSRTARGQMTEKAWQEILVNEIWPDYLAKGQAPAAQHSDPYEQRWMKLVWMELRDAVSECTKEQDRQDSAFDRTCRLTVTLGKTCDEKGRFAVTIKGADQSNGFKLPEDSAGPADFVHALLKLRKGLGWVYVRAVQFPDKGDKDKPQKQKRSSPRTKNIPEHEGPVQGLAFFYSESFIRAEPPKVFGEPCMLLSDFCTCLNRFQALKMYPGVCPILRSIIESPYHAKLPLEQDSLKALPKKVQSKLNSVQLRILQDIKGPVDFVQGPPGTGKSTFIVELLRTRVPAGSRVLLCTTTNKAIDSLTEKIHACGYEDILALGNPARLGQTSLRFTLEERVERNPSMSAAVDVYAEAVKASSWWKNQMEAVKRAVEDIEKAGLPVGMHKRILEQEVLEKGHLKVLVLEVQAALRHLLDMKDHIPDVKAYLKVKRVTLEPFLGDVTMTVDNISCLIYGVTDFARTFKDRVRAELRLHIAQTSRFFVCTAASAVKLPLRLERELRVTPDGGKDILDLQEELAAISQRLASCSLPVGAGYRSQKELHEALAKLDWEFQYVILDEAGAMLEPDMVGTIIHGCKFLLLVGDHHQLPPFTTWRNADAHGYNTSFLQRLVERPGLHDNHNLMTVQYRMHPHLSAIVSDTFYGGQLVTAASVVAARLRPSPVQFVDVDGQEQKADMSFMNVLEARAVVDIVLRELKETKNWRIDVIAFHRPQMHRIRKLLEEKGVVPKKSGRNGTMPQNGAQRRGRVDVITVDSMQGREADVIVLSCVRSGAKKSIGFLRSANRTNVAISRAREQLYVVGHREALKLHGTVFWKKVINHGHMQHVAHACED